MSLLYVGVLLLFLCALFRRKLLNNKLWNATMTPLASIIGSGFLISAPILHELGGDKAPYLMIFLCTLSMGIGQVLRWNIYDIEPLAEAQKLPPFLKWVERFSDWALSFAYVLSISYYIYLFSSFLLNSVGVESLLLKRAITTLVFTAIAFYGHQNGLNSIEGIEKVSVNIKLGIIFTFLVALVVCLVQGTSPAVYEHRELGIRKTLPVLLGLLIMVQGFETSRYLSEKYSAELRVKSMFWAQVLSSVIYIFFIFVFSPIIAAHPLVGEVNETSVIELSRHVFKLGPVFLLVAAIASQLSAAVADMGGAGGLISELTHEKIKSKNAYLLVASLGVVLVWGFDIFQIISFASKAFALYYFLQSVSSCYFNFRKIYFKSLYSFVFSALCLLVVFWGIPFEG
ncbi:MAG: hypothetical protein R3A80_13995 [Bdellovibrionota bacterium]